MKTFKNITKGNKENRGNKGKTFLIDAFVLPVHRFISQEKSSSIILGISVLTAIILANSPVSENYFNFLGSRFGFHFNGVTYLNFSIYHWINDGLMAIFFFVVGLELKREIVEGELSNPRKAILPAAAAFGGMIVPALIYLFLNRNGEVSNGWGIPMATDIAFALGVLYLLGKRIPVSLKIFLTALAIVDDLGAVLVIAIFYSSTIDLLNLLTGLFLLTAMYLGNKAGIRNLFFYAILGVAGVWVAFLLSGIHATVAAVISAFTIPADVVINQQSYISKIKERLHRLNLINLNNDKHTLSEEQIYLFNSIKKDTNSAIPPLQRLENALHPFAIFIVLPVFAMANAGISLQIHLEQIISSVTLGVASGLLVGKFIGVVGATLLMVKLKIAILPAGVTVKHILGIGLLASIGFTMSLFITSLAFNSSDYMVEAKLGIFTASIIGGILGYITLYNSDKSTQV